MVNVVETDQLRWIVLLPLLGFFAGVFAARTDRPQLARFTGPAVVIGAFVVVLIAVGRLWSLPADGALVDRVFTWIEAGPLAIDFTFRIDR